MKLKKLRELEEMTNSFPPEYLLIKRAFISKINEVQHEINSEYSLKSRSVSWSVLDFKGRAEQIVKANPTKHYVFDDSRFEDVLEKMISKHDCNIGITWNTIDFYLMKYCLKSFERDDYESKLH